MTNGNPSSNVRIRTATQVDFTALKIKDIKVLILGATQLEYSTVGCLIRCVPNKCIGFFRMFANLVQQTEMEKKIAIFLTLVSSGKESKEIISWHI